MSTATPITSQADWDAAIAEPSLFVTVYIHEGPVPEDMTERFQAIAPLFQGKVLSYKLDLEQNPAEVSTCPLVRNMSRADMWCVMWQAREKIKAEKLPALLVFKEGKEVDRVYQPQEAEMKALIARMLG